MIFASGKFTEKKKTKGKWRLGRKFTENRVPLLIPLQVRIFSHIRE